MKPEHLTTGLSRVRGGSLNRTAGRVSLAIFGLAVAGLIAFGTGQASASHVSCGDTITADTTLDSDLLDCPNIGIVIGADDITLDLNGYLVDGDDTPVVGCGFCDIGVLNEGHDGVTVRDGSVSEFAAGVYLYDPVAEDPAHHNRVLGIYSSERIFVVGNRNVIARNRVSRGGVLVYGDRNVIARNRVFGAGVGIGCTDAATWSPTTSSFALATSASSLKAVVTTPSAGIWSREAATGSGSVNSTAGAS